MTSALLVLLVACVPNPAALDEPTQAVVGLDGLVYVSDGYSNARVAVFGQDGRFRYSWGSKGFGAGQFNTPHGIATLSDGSILVADRGNARVQRFRADGAFLEQWYGDVIGRPWSVAVGDGDNVFLVDGGDQDDSSPRSGLIKMNSNGEVLCRWSSYGNGPEEIDWGHMLAVSGDGSVFVVDLNNRRLLKFTERSPGACDYAAVPGWPAADFGADFSPLGIAVRDQFVYVSERHFESSIRVLDAAAGGELDAIGAGLFAEAHGLFADGSSVWVADRRRNRVTRLGLDGTVMLQIGALNPVEGGP